MKTQTRPYPVPDNTANGDPMPKRTFKFPETKEPFGARLRRLRKAADINQKEFAQAIGISQRMVAYYEIETSHPPTHLLPVFAKVLRVSTDQLLGVEKVKVLKQRDTRLRRLLEDIEQLPASERKHVAQYMENVVRGFKAGRQTN